LSSLPDSVVADLLPVLDVILSLRHDLALLRRHVRAVREELAGRRVVGVGVTRDAKEIGEFVAFDANVTFTVTLNDLQRGISFYRQRMYSKARLM
jgi:hypothetical protein